MRIKAFIMSILFLLMACFTVSAQEPAAGTQLIFDKPAYYGYGVRPVVTLFDADLNVRADIREEIDVIVKSSSDPEGISVNLVETALDSGVFIGFFDLGPSISDDVKNNLRIAYNDSITAIYYDTADAASHICTAAWKPSSGTVEFDNASYAGQYSSATVTVRDQDLNVNSSIRDTTSVKITSDADSMGIMLKLNETGPNSGIFSGSLKFSTAASNSIIGVIKVGTSSSITAEYTDLVNSENVMNEIVSAKAAFKFTEAVIETSAEDDFGSGNMLDVIIFEPDSNNPDRVDTITAKVGAGISADDLILHLYETGTNTGEFRQTVYCTDRESNRKLLYLPGKDKINIKYVDWTVPQGGSKEIIKTVGWDYQSTVITLDKESYAGYNSSAKVTLYNMELNNHNSEVDNVFVDVVTNNSREMSLELKETQKSSGIFAGTLYFGKSSDRNNNIIKMEGEDSILISYENWRNKSDIAECYAEWTPQDGKLTLNRQSYSGNAAVVEVTLEDWDIANDTHARDEINVAAKIPGTSRKRTVKLTETKRDSGIFTGNFYINGGAGRNPSIELEPGEALEVEYTDEDTVSGNEEVRTANAVWTGISKAELTLDQIGYKGYGANMLVSLKDPDYNRNSNARESVEVLIKNSFSMNGIRYVLKETDNDTGVFTASLSFSADSSNYSNIKVADKDKITVILVDKNVSVTADFSK